MQYFVNASSGNDANTGLERTVALKTIQKAIDKASSGDVICVADGTYSPIRCDWAKPITIQSENGPERTTINGGRTSQCAWLGYGSEEGAKSQLVGFTLERGKATEGGGARGGILRSRRCDTY